jgi:hypothetical protein
MKKITAILLIAISLPATIVFGEGKGTVYSRYGVGELNSFMSGRSLGMGYTGLAILSDGTINRENPAALSRLAHVRFEADFQYTGYGMNDGINSSYLSTGNFQSIMLALPVNKKYGIVIAGGITPFSSVAYAVKSQETYQSVSATRSVEGSGGLTNAQIATSVTPTDDLSLGLTLHYLFGTIHHKQTLTFTSSDYFTSESDRQLSASGFASTIGAVYTGLDKALSLSTAKNLNAAVTLFTGSSLSLTQSVLQNYATVTDTVVEKKSGTMEIPLTVGIGLAYLLQDRTILAVDGTFGNWSQYQELGVHPSEIRNTMRLGVGIDFLSSRGIPESYWDQLSYRVGLGVNSSYLKVNNQAINEYYVTGGFSFPLSTAGGESRLNIAAEYGVRGITSFNLEKDSILRLTFSFTANELSWFVQPEIE